MSKDHSTDESTQLQTRVEQRTDPGGGASAQLVVIQGPELGNQFSLDQQPLVIGRSADVGLSLSAPGVSRQHCRIEFSDGEYWIEDLGSTNHTRINEVVQEREKLNDGDRIRLGQTVLKFISADNPEAAYHAKVHEAGARDEDTGLYSRRHLEANLTGAVESASASPENLQGGIFYIELDNPADIRDQVGMAGTDRVLALVGRRVSEFLDDHHLPARFGEHSLVVMVRELDTDGLCELAEQIQREVAGTVFEIGDHEVAAVVSIGVCPFSLRISDADSLLVCAARAADRAHAAGGNRCELYEPQVSAYSASEDEMAMLGLLRESLSRNTMQTLFQPAVSTGDDELTHYQLLPRLHTDDDELIRAADFVPVAERHAEIRGLDRWMSVRALSVIREQLGKGNQLRLFISQSADSLSDGKRFESLAKNLESEIADNRLLVLQFSEKDISRHLKAARKLLPRLRELGFGLSVSDIDGLSQVSKLLSHVQPDYFRLTGRFAAGVGHDHRVTVEFDNLVSSVHDADARIIIGQVEDAEAMGRLWSSRADLLLGNFIQRPTQTPEFSL